MRRAAEKIKKSDIATRRLAERYVRNEPDFVRPVATDTTTDTTAEVVVVSATIDTIATDTATATARENANAAATRARRPRAIAGTSAIAETTVSAPMRRAP